MTARLAYIAHGQLRLLAEGDGRGRDFDSPFATQVHERMASLQRRSAWKEGGSSFAAETARQAAHAGRSAPVRFVDVARGGVAGEWLHVLHTGAVSGLFVVDASGSERRVLHTEQFDMRHVAARPGDELLACAVTRGGATNIAVVRTDGSELLDVTEGDSLDLAPSWVPGPGHRIVFQSAGLPRGDASPGSGRAPFAIQLVDADRGEMETLAEDPQRDLLLPRMSADGCLHYIRCPHRPPAAPLAWRIAELLMGPVYFMRGVFGFFAFFARMNQDGGNARRARSGGAPHHDDVRLKDLLLQGTTRGAGSAVPPEGEHEPSSVSSAWELVRRTPQGMTEVVATRVFAYDLRDDGSLAWTDGTRIFVQRPGGPAEELARDHLVHDVAWLS